MASLIQTLTQQTESGAIAWRPTDLSGAFSYVASSGSVIVRGPAAGLSGLIETYSIQVLDAGGNKVEQFSTGTNLFGPVNQALRLLFDRIVERYSEGNPLLDSLRNEAAAATRPT
jgi:hypothetical protein